MAGAGEQHMTTTLTKEQTLKIDGDAWEDAVDLVREAQEEGRDPASIRGTDFSAGLRNHTTPDELARDYLGQMTATDDEIQAVSARYQLAATAHLEALLAEIDAGLDIAVRAHGSLADSRTVIGAREREVTVQEAGTEVSGRVTILPPGSHVRADVHLSSALVRELWCTIKTEDGRKRALSLIVEAATIS
jgi:hypothetical protein